MRMQDPESASSTVPQLLLRFNNDEDLHLHFRFVVQSPHALQAIDGNDSSTQINNLTFAFASNYKDLEALVTRDFHADPNIHKNANVELLGDVSTNGNSSLHFDWSWNWRPPKFTEDRGGGWRNTFSFMEYDSRAHKLETLAIFGFWVQNTARALNSPEIPSPPAGLELRVPQRVRYASSQSAASGITDSDPYETLGPPSPAEPVEAISLLPSVSSKESTRIDVSCQRPGEDMSAQEDGPLFRATMKALEQKTGNMRMRMKKVLRKAEAAHIAQRDCNDAVTAFTEALREACKSNANAVQPALEHYFEQIARVILEYEKQNSRDLKRLIIDPISKLYNIDIKQAEAKKKDFEDESRDYYAYLSRYLGQRQDSLKEKKRNESDTKYQTKRRNFELKRFDYSSFMQDLHGGRKEQEVLSCLTRYADSQAKSYLTTAKIVEEKSPQLGALIREVNDADKDFRMQRTEREEKRRNLEKSTKSYREPEISGPLPSTPNPAPAPVSQKASYMSDSELSRAGSTGRNDLHYSSSTASNYGTNPSIMNSNGMQQPGKSLDDGSAAVVSPERFRGIRDLEERDYNSANSIDSVQHRKEGLLWSMSKPGSHADPKGLNKTAWHKFWIVLDQGKLSEYSNWKQKLDLHMEPIDLRMASVRESRSSERRFCFEILTPTYTRVYQAPSEADMHNWINSINNALQGAFEAKQRPVSFFPTPGGEKLPTRDIGSVLTGKTSSSHAFHHHHSVPSYGGSHGSSPSNVPVSRRITVGARPIYVRNNSHGLEEEPAKLLQIVRNRDEGNKWCADCGSMSKAEWVSINLGIVLCIECSGIHRSLGTHISKVRSLTLDTTSFTTDIVELLLLVGNRVSNMIWEATLDPALKLSPQSSRDQRLQFITAKYANRAYVQPMSFGTSHYNSADETLLASIKKNDIRGVIYGLALRANPNAADRSRNTHCVFLALAAADPASPGGGPPIMTRSPKESSTPNTISFPVAELLVQNGAQIPSSMPAIPLSQAAKLYIEQKAARDTVSELPTIPKSGGPGGFPETEKQKDSAKLQKRGSAGGRLIGRHMGQ